MVQPPNNTNHPDENRQKFEAFLQEWYYNRASESNQIMVGLPDENEGELLIWIELYNNKTYFTLLSEPLLSPDWTFVSNLLDNKFFCQLHRYHANFNKDKIISFITHLLLISQEWQRHISNNKSLFDYEPFEHKNYPIFDYYKILYFINKAVKDKCVVEIEE